MKRRTGEFDYKYIIAGICFIMVFVGLGFCSTAKTIYFAPITEALGFFRSSFSINDSCRYITTAILNIFFGALVERFGTKKLIIAGMMSLIISSLLYSAATTLFVFYLGGVFLGIGVAWTTTSMVGSAAIFSCQIRLSAGSSVVTINATLAFRIRPRADISGSLRSRLLQ